MSSQGISLSAKKMSLCAAMWELSTHLLLQSEYVDVCMYMY